MSARIENYLGFPIGLSGAELASRAVAQASRFGAEILSPQEVVAISEIGNHHCVHLASGEQLKCATLLIATGVSYRQLAIPGADRLTGAGVYYGAAMTEAASLQGKHIYIVGGANSAGQAALSLAKVARQVTILVRGKSLSESMSYYLLEEIRQCSTIEVLPLTEVVECQGSETLERLILTSSLTGATTTVEASALFIFIGASPHTQWLPENIARDKAGFVLTGETVLKQGWALKRSPLLLESSVPGIFVAGDVRAESMKRVASAVGDGAIAVALIHQYLRMATDNVAL